VSVRRPIPVGSEFGSLVAIEPAKVDKGPSRTVCRCTRCGTVRSYRNNDLRCGHITGCGCLLRLPLGVAAMRIVMKAYKTNAARRHRTFDLNEEEFRQITSSVCFYCGSPPSNVSGQKANNGLYVYNGIDRVDNDIGYTADNCVPCCWPCNSLKETRSKDDFLAHIARIYVHVFGSSRASLPDVNGDLLVPLQSSLRPLQRFSRGRRRYQRESR